MGVQITELLPLREIGINELSGKVIAIDAPIFLYQFLTTIRQRDGTLLMDSGGNVTSHLSGIFFRSLKHRPSLWQSLQSSLQPKRRRLKPPNSRWCRKYPGSPFSRKWRSRSLNRRPRRSQWSSWPGG